MSVTTLFFFTLLILLLMIVRVRGFLWSVAFFGGISIVLLHCDPRGDERTLETTICIQEDDRGDLFLEYETYTHHITRDSFLHSWGCIQAGDSVHVYLTKNYEYKNLIYSRSPEFILVKEDINIHTLLKE